MIILVFILLTQSNGDTLRWYVTNPFGPLGMSYSEIWWGASFLIDSPLDGRTIHSGRAFIWDSMPYPGTMNIFMGTDVAPDTLVQTGTFYATGQGFYEVTFGDSTVIHTGDHLWLVCYQRTYVGRYCPTMDSGPGNPSGGWVSFDGSIWSKLSDYGLNYNWVMELILTPTDVEEGPAKPEEKLALLPAPGGFWITGYEGPAWIYDPAGRLVLSKEIKGKTLISPLRPGVYFVIAERQRARVAVK
jgi:hypothetical protein